MKIDGAVALVTGASAGIGAAVASRLAAGGARVVVHGRDETRTRAVAAACGGVPVMADLVRPDAPAHVVKGALDACGRVDLLVASAGIGWSGPFVEMDAAAIEDLLRVDLLATVAVVHGVLPGMLERRRGRIVLVSSVAGRTGVAGEAVYSAAKAGLDAFAESLRLELAGTGVGVGVVVPAAVSTDFFATRGRPYDRRIPRPVSAETVARSVVTSIERDRAEVWVPRWLQVASVVRAVAPGPYRRLATRFGEPVRSLARGGDET